MKKKTLKIIILIWLAVLTAKVFQLDSNIKWVQAQQDNVIELLMTEK